MSSERTENSRSCSKSIKKEEENSECEASYRIQTVLALEAWRRQKQENDELKFNVKTLSEKVDALQLQRYALRQLLDAEKIRLAIINNDVHKILNDLEECKLEKNILLKEREQLQDRIRVLEENFAGMVNEYKNQKNDLFTAKMEAQSWERQLEKEREKLSKMKDDKKNSIEEVAEEAKEMSAVNNRKVQREARVKSTTCRNTKKNSGRVRDLSKIDNYPHWLNGQQ